RHLRPLTKLQRLYDPELLAQTLAIARRCTFSLTELRYEYPKDLVPADYSAADYLQDRKSTRLNSSHVKISYAVFCLKKKIPNITSASIKTMLAMLNTAPTRKLNKHNKITMRRTSLTRIMPNAR